MPMMFNSLLIQAGLALGEVRDHHVAVATTDRQRLSEKRAQVTSRPLQANARRRRHSGVPCHHADYVLECPANWL